MPAENEMMQRYYHNRPPELHRSKLMNTHLLCCEARRIHCWAFLSTTIAQNFTGKASYPNYVSWFNHAVPLSVALVELLSSRIFRRRDSGHASFDPGAKNSTCCHLRKRQVSRVVSSYEEHILCWWTWFVDSAFVWIAHVIQMNEWNIPSEIKCTNLGVGNLDLEYGVSY